jgi:uncharacterized protein (TIRG00374 family)
VTGRTRWAIAGALLGVAFLGIALVQADPASTWAIVREADAAWSLVALASGLAFMLTKAVRWKLLLRPVTDADVGTLHRAVYVGTAANLVVSHAGELLRAALLARRAHVPGSAVLATIALERVLDVAALVALVAAALLWEPAVSPLLATAGLVAVALLAGGVLVVAAVVRPGAGVVRLGGALLRRIPARARPGLRARLGQCAAALGGIRELHVWAAALVLSIAQWGCIVGAVWASVQAVGASVGVPVAIAVFALTVIGLALASAPAQLGTTQLAFVLALEVHGLSASIALAASVVYTGVVVLTMMVLGGLVWLRADWSRAA